MYASNFNYLRASSIVEAGELLRQHPGAREERRAVGAIRLKPPGTGAAELGPQEGQESLVD